MDQLQAVLHVLEAPFQVPDIDLDVVGDCIGAGPAKLRSNSAILLPRELGVELHDAAVNRLQLQDLGGRGLLGGKRHASERMPPASTASVLARCMHARTKSMIARGLTTITSTFLPEKPR
jgi:hypothetical protein